MTFRLTSTDYGPGRAGQNLVGSSGYDVPINTNAQAAVGYGKLTNGTMYLVTHEIAYSLAAMQQYSHEQWVHYVANNPGLTPDQLNANYPFSVEFAANEARANTVARAIAQNLGFGAMSPDPMWGYQVC